MGQKKGTEQLDRGGSGRRAGRQRGLARPRASSGIGEARPRGGCSGIGEARPEGDAVG